MNVIKKLLLVVGALFFMYLSYIGMYLLTQKYSFSIGNSIAENINQKNILSLKIGMNEEDVVKILGEPIDIIKYTKKEYPNYGAFETFIYGKTGFFDGGIEVNLAIQDKKLKQISLDNYDVSFYFCSKENCPKIIDNKIFNHWINK